MTDRTATYTTRLDSHLATLAADKREAFLQAEFAKWEQRYLKFQRDAANDKLELAPSHATAYDYIFTMAEISKRLVALKVAA